jgi:predicted nucleotidyltransferase
LPEQPYPLIFATFSGAHLYGFASPDSDWDVPAVHVLPAAQLLGLRVGEKTRQVERKETDFELDLVTHDARKFFQLMLRKNGYVLEQLHSPLVVYTTPEHDELREIARSCVARYPAHHYLEFAATQWRLFEKESPRRIEPLLYVYRVLLTGLHLLRSDEIEANSERLNADRRLPRFDELIAQRASGSAQQTVDELEIESHRATISALRNELEQSIEQSSLPTDAIGQPALHDLLL